MPAHTETMHAHGRQVHSHPHDGPHRHLALGSRRFRPIGAPPAGAHGRHHHDRADPHRRERHAHAHALVDDSIKRSRDGIRAVSASLAVLGGTALAQTIVFIASGSVALLADLIHNVGDAATALPLGIAFMLRSPLAERRAGLFVVAAIFISACVAGVEAFQRLIHPTAPSHLAVLAISGLIGYAGNLIAARIRTNAGRRLDSAALIADGNHARADAYVSLPVVASAAAVAIGATIADPIIGLAITVVILNITRQYWHTVRGHHSH